MSDWINRACDEVDRLAAQKPYFQELDAQRKALEPLYQQILDSLPESDRKNLIEYEYLISELAYQKMQTAYQLGCRRMV